MKNDKQVKIKLREILFEKVKNLSKLYFGESTMANEDN